jgi:D-3-phosphoglycerate dehydrogenase
MIVLANDGISDAGKVLLEENGFTVVTDKVAQENLIDYINEHHVSALLVRSATKVRKDIIDGCNSLRLIGRGGVGMDNIDVEYARNKGLHVVNTPASSSQSVAELVMGHMFSIARFLPDSFKNMEEGDFSVLKKKYAKGMELRGKTLGIIGFGRIGQALATYALGIGMNVKAFGRKQEKVTLNLNLNENVYPVDINVSADLNEVLSQSDFISLHVPKQEGNKPVISKEEFEMMKDGSILINAARGGVVNERDLLEALSTGKLAYAGLDVFENEPNPDKLLLQNHKISCTPHIGAATVEAQDRIGEELASLIIEKLK